MDGHFEAADLEKQPPQTKPKFRLRRLLLWLTLGLFYEGIKFAVLSHNRADSFSVQPWVDASSDGVLAGLNAEKFERLFLYVIFSFMLSCL